MVQPITTANTPDAASALPVVPKTLPKCKPGRRVLRARRHIYQSDAPDPKAVAIHEAAHAAVFLKLGDRVNRASILVDDCSLGRVHVDRGHIRAGAILGSLAGHAAEWIAGCGREIDPDDSDFHDIVQQFPGNFAMAVPAVWRDTVHLLTDAFLWRATVRIADDLLNHGEVTEDELVNIYRATTNCPVEGLEEARARVVSEGKAAYGRALRFAARHKCDCGCHDRATTVLDILPEPYRALPSVIGMLPTI